MLNKRFFLSWIFSSVVMFLLSYFWHGIFLTDFSRISYPRSIFLLAAVIVYLIIGFVVAKAISVRFLENTFKRKPVLRGLIAGAGCGFMFFLIATVIGISFSTGSRLENLLLDVSWQCVEQAAGGVVVGVVHIFVFDPSTFIED